MAHDFKTSMMDLQAAIIDNDPAKAIALLGRKTPSLENRLGAYIQGYRIRLCKVVENDYPTLKHYMGDDALYAHIKDYVEHTPSQSYTIDQYPIGFAAYIAQAVSDPAAISIAALEAAISHVFWLPDSDVFIPTEDFSMEQLFTLKLELRTASKLLELPGDAENYLTAFRQDETPVITDKPCYLVVVRHENEVKRHRLTNTEYHLLSAIARLPFSEAIEHITKNNDDMAGDIAANLSQWLIIWITAGFFKAN